MKRAEFNVILVKGGKATSLYESLQGVWGLGKSIQKSSLITQN